MVARTEALLAILTDWQQRMRECQAQMDAAATIFGPTPEAPLPAAVYHLMGDYTRCIAVRIHWCDDALAAWWLDHNFGERPMQIGIGNEPLRTVSTIEELAQFIADDHARNTDGADMRTALLAAREFIAAERQNFIECNTDPTTHQLDPDDFEHAEHITNLLAQIDAATGKGESRE